MNTYPEHTPTSNAFEAVCRRLEIPHVTIVSTPGESYLNWMETHVHIQRRLSDDQFSLARTPGELEQRHQAFIHKPRQNFRYAGR